MHGGSTKPGKRLGGSKTAGDSALVWDQRRARDGERPSPPAPVLVGTRRPSDDRRWRRRLVCTRKEELIERETKVPLISKFSVPQKWSFRRGKSGVTSQDPTRASVMLSRVRSKRTKEKQAVREMRQTSRKRPRNTMMTVTIVLSSRFARSSPSCPDGPTRVGTEPSAQVTSDPSPHAGRSPSEHTPPGARGSGFMGPFWLPGGDPDGMPPPLEGAPGGKRRLLEDRLAQTGFPPSAQEGCEPSCEFQMLITIQPSAYPGKAKASSEVENLAGI